jgi:hypothetical protein
VALFSEEFAGWRDSDFDAFAQSKWRSNRYTPERTQVRLRLATAMESAVAAAGLSAAGLQLWSSRPEPAFTNEHEVRSLTLAWTRVGAEDVETAHMYAGLAVDVANVTLRLRLPGEQQMAWQPMRATLAELAALADMRVRIGGVELDVGALAGSELPGDLMLERVMPRSEAIAGLLTVDELAAWSGVVLPLLAQLLGITLESVTPMLPAAVVETAIAEELPVPIDLTLDAEEPVAPSLPSPGSQRDPPARRGYRPQWAPQNASRTTGPVEAHAAPVQVLRPPIDRIMPPTWHPEPPRRPEPAPYFAPPRRTEPNRYPAPSNQAPMRRTEPQQQPTRPQHASFAPGRPFELGPSPQKSQAISGVLAAGARVELLKGLFAGKTGTVAEVAGAHVQVLLGLMSVRMPTGDLRVL